MLLGVDVGGTFTDAVLVRADGHIVTAKSPTTPDDQSAGVLAAVGAVLDLAGASPRDVRGFAHGMTVATNALLEGRGAPTAFVATEGFTDVVELGRQARASLYRLDAAHPPPLVAPARRVAVGERMTPDGPLRPLSAERAAAVAREVAELQVESVAVCLLHADRHPEHELLLGQALEDALGPDVHVSLSHEVVGTFREYERAATTEIDAALSPLLAGYLRALTAAAGRAGLPEPAIMQSSGGLTDVATAAEHAAFTVLSGPAGGAAAAELLSRQTGIDDLLCFDMGGTSCDVCVVTGGVVARSSGRDVGGRPLALPMVDIHTVGAGGGSIAWRDAGGALRVGPRSAGAIPGPACYGRGGSAPTVTDAHAVLGRLEGPLPGPIELDLPAARAAIAGLAAELGMDDLDDVAAGILAVAETEMLRALRVMTVERGIDPRGFTLLAFGGAGGLHACALAEALGMSRVLVPDSGGVLSALGMAAADQRRDEARTVMLSGSSLTDSALADAVGDADEVAWDVRYRGQSHELTVSAPRPCVVDVVGAFEAAHDDRYGHTDPESGVEVVTIRRTFRTPGPRVTPAPDGDSAGELEGPLMIRREGSTIWLAEGWRAGRVPAGGLMLGKVS
jgi:N-methylhydantoinase A/oxoprolinase/acetone carboxylase beta subunit